MKSWTNPFNEYQYFINNDDYSIKGTYSTINTYYQHNFTDVEHKITANVNNVIWDGGGDEISDNYLADNNFKIFEDTRKSHRGIADSRTFMNKSQIDYTLPIAGKYSFEAGYCFDYVQDFSDYLYRDYEQSTKDWITNYNFTNNTKFFHTINAVYTTFAGSMFDINYQLGLRAEYYNRRLFQETNKVSYTYEKMNYFPSLHISKAFNPTTQMQFSYSKRVQRPDVYVLNPFPDYADDYIVSIGNPDLMPEFTDSYELNFSKSYDMLFLTMETYYRNTDNAIGRIMKMDNGRLLITSENVGTNNIYGLELSANINLFKKLRLNISANMYNYEISSKDPTFQSNAKGDVIDGNIQLSYSINGNSMIQISSVYNGPKYFTDGSVESTYGVGFAVRQFFFDKKLTIFLTGRNVLNTYEFRHTNERHDYKSYGYMKPQGGVISLGLSFNINNYQNKVRPEDKIERTSVGGSGGY
jgi:outer membrane receptor protein involved in Fe transport